MSAGARGRPRVHVVATGGTIAMTGSPARPARSGADLLAAVPALDAVADLSVEELSNVPGAALTLRDMAQAVLAAWSAVADGAAGAVVLQGTDTIEEATALAALAWDSQAPLVYTGAIRPGGAAGSDGPSNLFDAVVLAASPAARGAGVVACFDGVVHPGEEVVKSHSWRSDAFSSPLPLGFVKEGEAELRLPASRPAPVVSPRELAEAPLDAFVPIVAAAAGDEGRALEAVVAAGARAVVVEALGAGHLPPGMLPAVDRAIAADVQVVVCAGTVAGGTLARTYGFDGSETDLAARGAVLAGRASARKLRVRSIPAMALGMAVERVL